MFNLLSDKDTIISIIFIIIFIIVILIIVFKKPKGDTTAYIDYVLDSNGNALLGIYQIKDYYVVKNFNTGINAYFKTYQEVEIFIKNWNNWTTKKSN